MVLVGKQAVDGGTISKTTSGPIHWILGSKAIKIMGLNGEKLQDVVC